MKFGDIKSTSGSFEKLKKLEEESVKVQYPVCVPTYKNRDSSLIHRIPSLGEGTDVRVFIYESDYKVSGYDKIVWPNNVKVVMVPEEYKTSMKMRKFITETMGEQMFWHIDDDVADTCVIHDEEAKHCKRVIPLWKCIAIAENVQKMCGAALFGVGGCELQTRFFNDRNPLYSSRSYIYTMNLIDGKQFKEHGIEYTGDTEVGEDIEISLLTMLADCKVSRTTFMHFNVLEPYGGNTSSVAGKGNMLIENIYLKYGSYINMSVCSNGVQLKCTLGFKDIQNRNKVYDADLKAACEAHDDAKVIEIINQRKAAKKKN